MTSPLHEVEIPTDAPDEALAFLVDRLGFRPLSVYPASDPALAEVEGHGLRLRLCRRGSDLEAGFGPLPAVAEICPPGGAVLVGRAGMHYRDLCPSRMGGRVIASHICVPGTGPVPDRVHYHEIGFQLIHCLSGWVRVAYEGLPGPVVLRAGDGLLQPPLIRHRVLEAGDGLEVLEVAVPALHPTRFDPECELAGPEQDPVTRLPAALAARTYGGQRFVFYRADSASTGIGEASGGVAEVRRHSSAATLEPGGWIRLIYVEDGTPTFGGRKLAPGTLVSLPPNAADSPPMEGRDCRLLEIRIERDPTESINAGRPAAPSRRRSRPDHDASTGR